MKINYFLQNNMKVNYLTPCEALLFVLKDPITF